MTRFILLLAATAGFCDDAHAQHFSRGLDLVNRSHAAVLSFHVANAGSDQWDQDLLRRRGLQPNHFVQLDLADPTGFCRFDFKVEFADGTNLIRRNVNVCTQQTYTLTDRPPVP